MTDKVQLCYTCRKSDSGKLINVQNLDTDKITYLQKLKTCIAADLLEIDPMKMCSLCVNHLRISYQFKLQVLMSQEILRKNSETQQLMKKDDNCEEAKEFLASIEHDSCVKSESDSEADDFIKDDSYSSDSSDTDSKKHLKSLTKKKKNQETVICGYCDAKFSKSWQLRKHLIRVHNEYRKYICSYCGKEFKQSYHLKEHITSHTGEKNYSCPICDKKFQRQSSQRRHIKSHEAPPGQKTKRTPFLCTICGKSFPFSNGVQRHMRIHLGIKNFECKLCNRKFTQSTHLQVHMRTHTGEKPYICDTCGEKFSLKSCMLKHINNRHCRSKTITGEFPIFYLPKLEPS